MGVRATGSVRSVAILRREPEPARDGGAGRRAVPSITRRSTIALVGIDGSGKTTQARRLADALTSIGAPATYWQNAGGRRWFGRLARRLGRADGQHLLGRRGLLLAESVLRWLAIARALLRSRITGRTAVMDRYAACQYASIRAHGGRGPDRGGPGERLARLAYRAFPAPDITFLLAVDPAEAHRRIEARGTDHESLRYLTRAHEAYHALPERSTFVIIDAGGSLDEVTSAVFAHVPELAPPAASDRGPTASIKGKSTRFDLRSVCPSP